MHSFRLARMVADSREEFIRDVCCMYGYKGGFYIYI